LKDLDLYLLKIHQGNATGEDSDNRGREGLFGFAVVLVDNKFRVKLEASMFYGPGELIKKGTRFRTRATVIELDGKIAILIHDVVEAI
jgi:hypothetical protein